MGGAGAGSPAAGVRGEAAAPLPFQGRCTSGPGASPPPSAGGKPGGEGVKLGQDPSRGVHHPLPKTLRSPPEGAMAVAWCWCQGSGSSRATGSAGWEVAAPSPLVPTQGTTSWVWALAQAQGSADSPPPALGGNGGSTPSSPTLEKSPMSSRWSLASRFSISSWQKDLERSSRAFCGDANPRHRPGVSEGAGRARARGSPTAGTPNPEAFLITHRLRRRLLARGTGHAPPPLGFDGGVPVRGPVYPLQDGPDDAAGH